MSSKPNYRFTDIKNYHAHGFTLVEIAIVLGIMGVVLGVIWTVASYVREHQRVNTAVSQIGLIVGNMRSLYFNAGVFDSGKLTIALMNTDILPSNTIDPTNITVNPWRTITIPAIPGPGCAQCGIGVGTQTGWGASGMTPQLHNTRVLAIGYWGIPATAARRVLAHFIGSSAGEDVIAVYCDGMASFLPNPLTVPPSTATVTVDQLTCLNGAGGGSNAVLFFKK